MHPLGAATTLARGDEVVGVEGISRLIMVFQTVAADLVAVKRARHDRVRARRPSTRSKRLLNAAHAPDTHVTPATGERLLLVCHTARNTPPF